MSKLDEFVASVKRKGTTVRAVSKSEAQAITGRDLETTAGGATTHRIKGAEPMSWSLPFPPPPGPVNPWSKEIGKPPTPSVPSVPSN